MRYCTKCKCLFPDSTDTCPEHNKKLISDPAPASPVRIMTAGGFEFERIAAALDSAGIAYSYSREENDAVFRAVAPSAASINNIYVKISDYCTARELMQEIGAHDERAPYEPDEEEKKKISDAKKEEDEELSPGKARAIRIVSGIAFLLLLAAVVYATDHILALLQTLFGA